MATLIDSITRLQAFRATFNEGDLVDEESGVTAEDLAAVIDAALAFDESAVAPDQVEPSARFDVPLNTMVMSLSNVMTRMAQVMNSRLPGVSPEEQTAKSELFNEALRNHIQISERFVRRFAD